MNLIKVLTPRAQGRALPLVSFSAAALARQGSLEAMPGRLAARTVLRATQTGCWDGQRRTSLRYISMVDRQLGFVLVGENKKS